MADIATNASDSGECILIGPRDKSVPATIPCAAHGQNILRAGQARSHEIFRFTEIRNSRMHRSPRPKEEGVSRSSRHAGRTAVDAGFVGAKVVAGRETMSGHVAHTTGDVCVR